MQEEDVDLFTAGMDFCFGIELRLGTEQKKRGKKDKEYNIKYYIIIF